MEIRTKTHKAVKAKKYIKNDNLLFITKGLNQNAIDWITTEQSLMKSGANYFKILNKTTKRALKNSAYKKTIKIFNSLTVFIKPNRGVLLKKVITTELEDLSFKILAIKFTNKVYSSTQFKNLSAINYKKNMLLNSQFTVTDVKLYRRYFFNIT